MTAAPEQGVLSLLRDWQGEMIELLEQMVNIDSGTGQADGVSSILDLIEPHLQRLGFSVRREASPYGPHLVAWGDWEPSYLLMGHVDTVFPAGTSQKRPFQARDGIACGPGVADMKGGIVSLLYVLKALAAFSDAHRHARVLINCDEEISSPTSRLLTQEEARRCRAAFVFEPAQGLGHVTTRRKGVADLTLRIRGRASHAGAAPEDGVSAVEEAARKVLALHGLTQLEAGRSVNVGILSGGTGRNVVAEEAMARVDVRFATLADGQALLSEIRDICSASREEYTIELEGGMTRPPLEKLPQSEALLGLMREAAEHLGLSLEESCSGGVSDANLIAAAGTPVLDSLGPVAGHAHSDREWLDLSSMPVRAALAASTIHRMVGRLHDGGAT